MKELKGIYWDKENNNVYYVNNVEDGIAYLSTVLINSVGGIYRIENDNIKMDAKVVSNFYHSGNYSRNEIN